MDLRSRIAAVPSPGDQTGFGLIEVIVSALLITLVSLGVYLAIDGATVSAGINKHRTMATQLAQQDQDRMRAMAVNELSNYRATSRPPPLAGTTYSVDSSATWVTDSTGSASCASGTAQANYLRIQSSVTWPGMQLKPVTVESVIAPPNGSFGPNQGSLAVQVLDRNGVGVPGVSVTLAGPQGYSDVTNADGCVLWGYLPASTGSAYTLTISKAGYVDTSGAAVPTKRIDVTGEATNPISFDYDLGGRIQGVYQTTSGGVSVPANGLGFMVRNGTLSVPLGPWGDGALHASYTTPPLYPFTVAYAAYAGDCDGAAPTTPQNVTVTPGGTATVNLVEPPIAVTVVNGRAAVSGAMVMLTATGAGCSAVSRLTTDRLGVAAGALPYGTYAYCVPSGTKRVTGTLTSSTTAGASATVDLATASTGTCP